MIDRTKLKVITGFDAIILEERSGEGSSSALGSGRQPSSIQEVISAGREDQDDNENEYDLMDEEDCEERPEAPFRHLPESLHLKS
jgi:hypothetical protein